MVITNFIRGLVKKNPDLKIKLKRSNSKLSAFQYMYQTLTMTAMSAIGLGILVYLVSKSDLMMLGLGMLGIIVLTPIMYKFWINVVNVQISKLGREIDADILFVSEYLLVSLESGLPIGNAIENLSKIKRPGGEFFKRIYTEFKTGKSFDEALREGIKIAPSRNMKNLVKKINDSMSIGVDMRTVLETFILDSSEKKILEVKTFAKKLNPIIMMYLLMGIVMPSLGITFFILAAAMLELTPELLRIILLFVFLLMFGFQYFAYTMFKFNKATI